jgi:YD repeat-containing protein
MKKLILILTMAAATLAAEKLTYTYDGAGRLARVQSDSGRVITYTYDASGNLVKRAAGGAPAPAPAPEARRRRRK